MANRMVIDVPSEANLSTVTSCLEALSATYAEGLGYYNGWQRRQWERNHYAKRDQVRRPRTTNTFHAAELHTGRGGECALGASLRTSRSRLCAVQKEAIEAFGEHFIVGDAETRHELRANLSFLVSRVAQLRHAMLQQNEPLNLLEMISVSEAVQSAVLKAIAELIDRLEEPDTPTLEMVAPWKGSYGNDKQIGSELNSTFASDCQASTKTGTHDHGQGRIPRDQSLHNQKHKHSASPSGSTVRQQCPQPDRSNPSFPSNLNRRSQWLDELEELDDDVNSMYFAFSSNSLHFASEPPSPPPMPVSTLTSHQRAGSTKWHGSSVAGSGSEHGVDMDDLQSTRTASSGLRPQASVLSVFCSEAVKYQVDVRRQVPRKGSRCVCCGYDWWGISDSTIATTIPPSVTTRSSAEHNNSNNYTVPANIHKRSSTSSFSSAGTRTTIGSNHSSISEAKTNVTAASSILSVKDGFQLTPRFLGKSHHPGGGYACVLCVSRGEAKVFANIAGLRNHINVGHDKWQILHDRDFYA